MLRNIFYCNKWGAFLVLFSIAFLLPIMTASGQGGYECVSPSCGRLSVEVVRHGNVSPDSCMSNTSCNDKFRQIAYTVYLRHSKPINPQVPPTLPFDLDYDMLDITVSLKNLSSPQFSHIDTDATKTCFTTGIGTQWNYNSMDGNKAILTVTENSASISFANLAPNSPDCGTILPNGTGNKITFRYNPIPPLVVGSPSPTVGYAYAELFTIVVNAYPGELNGLQFDVKNYVPDFGIASICPIDPVVTGANNGLNNITILPSPHFTGTANASVFASLLAPLQSREFPIQIENIGPLPITVNYLEFIIRAMTVNIDQPFAFTGPIPEVSTSGGGKNLHYVMPDLSITLMPNQPLIIGSITITTPTLSNLSWAADFSFLDSGQPPSKSRIKTSNACTSLNASLIHKTSSNGGDALCSDPSILFKVEGEGLSCSTSKVNVGLSTTIPTANIRLNKVEFDLDFSWVSPNISISGVNFPASWPALNCATFGCYGSPGSKSCWEIGGGGKLFRFCYQTDDPNAPLFVLGFANIEILLNTPENACIDNVKITNLKINYVGNDNPPPCIPVIDTITGFPLCGSAATMLTGTITTEALEGVEEVDVTLSGADFSTCSNVSCLPIPCMPVIDMSDNTGFYQFACTACSTCNLVKVVPEKNDNPLNGVTTYDLVLISKHILGTEPLNSPFKMIAANANKIGGITTFDIVELRKLILGIYDSLPNNKSWRFVDKAFSFPNAANPFQTPFPESINCIAFPASGKDFWGIKIGDVNNSVMANRPVERPMVNLTWPNLRAVPGSTVTIPVSYSGSESLEAIQLGLRFDPNKLQLIGPSSGDIESYLPGNFNLLKAAEGEIRTLWLPMTDASEKIQPNHVLFYLSFKVLGEMTDSGLPLWLDNQLLDCAAWKPNGIEHTVQQNYPAAKREELVASTQDLQASIRPNPTVGDATLVVQALKAEKARVALFDAFGSRLFMRELLLQEGQQDIPLPEIAPLPSGVYVWKVYTPNFETQGHLVKQ